VNEIQRLDANNARAHSLLGKIAMYDRDIETAIRETQQALALAPNDPLVLRYATILAWLIGDFDETIRLGEKLTLLDPVSSRAWYILGHAAFVAGRLDVAQSAYRRAIELEPERIGSHAHLGAVILLKGDADAALASMNREVSDGRRIAGRALVFQAMGAEERARAELETLIKLGYLWTYEIAQNYAFRGELDKAFVWLDRAFDRRDSSLVFAVGDPFLDNLRDDPRFEDVLERLGVKSP
jgi:Flp pilus assembly protein TadD